MSLETEIGLVEAVLFLESEPIDLKGLVGATGLAREVVVQALAELRTHYDGELHGIAIVEIAGGYMLAPKTALWESLKERYGKKNENRLSRAALETLAIIAYSQPITRGEIESLRGVSADGMIKSLLDRGFIRDVGKKDAPGRPTQYGTTKEFLSAFRLNSIADLPKLDDLNRERFELDGE